MKKMFSILLLCALILIAVVQPLSAEDYQLGPGDVLNIGVYGYEELQLEEVMIRPDGKLAFPLVGEVDAAGISPRQLMENLTVALSEYVINPKVVVNIDKFKTTRVYVLGEVAKPGMYEIEKQHNVLDAIGIAGGFTEKAAKKNVFIIHKNQPDQPVKVNMLKLLERADLTQNVALADGDVVYLTRNRKIVFGRDILPYLNAWYQVDRLKD